MRLHPIEKGREACKKGLRTLVGLFTILLATATGHAQITGNNLMPAPVNMTQSGWDTTLQNGNLTFGLPIGVVPGEISIPVAFGMNASFYAHGWATRVYDPDLGKSVPVLNEIDRPIVGAVHFGYISAPATYSGTTVDGLTVIESGAQIADSQWTTFSANSTLGTVLNLPQAYGFTAVSISVGKVDPTATYLSYSTAISGIKSSYQSLITGNLPSGFGTQSSTYKVVMDKNKARVYAWAASVNAWVPVLWADRFGHYVTFQWVRSTTGLPSGITAITKVTATNQRSKGVVVRWADYSSRTSTVDLLRADFVGIHAPSVLLRGYSSYSLLQPAGYVDTYMADNLWIAIPSAVGASFRPTAIQIAPYASIPQPSWNGSVAAGVGPGAPPADGTSDSSARTWLLTYDSNLAELTSITDPRSLATTFSYTNYKATTTFAGTVGPRAVSRVDCVDAGNHKMSKQWTRTYATSTTPMTIKVEGWWDPSLATNPDRYHQIVFPTDNLNYGNGVYQTDTLMDTSNVVWSTTTFAYNAVGGGLNSSLSRVQSVSYWQNGSPTIKTSLGYPDTTKLQITQQNITAIDDQGHEFNVSSTTNTFNPRWDMLEGGQLTQSVTTRYKPDGVTALPSVTQKNEFDTPTSGYPLLQLQKSYLDGGATGKHGTSYSYDSEGRPYIQNIYHVEGSTLVSSPNSQWVNYDSTSGAIASSNQMDQTGLAATLSQTMGAFDSASRPTTTTDASGITTTLTYDDRGRVISELRPGRPTVIYNYPTELQLKVTANGAMTTTNYDGFGRVVSSILPSGVSTSGGLTYTTQTPSYDVYGRMVTLTEVNPAGTSRSSSWEYDSLDREISNTPTAGNLVTTIYSVSGISSKTTTTLANQTSGYVLKNALGQVLETGSPDGSVNSAAYDGMGNQTSATIQPVNNGTAQVRSWFFDALGRLTSKIEPETNTQSFSAFNALNQPTVVTEASGTGDARVRTLTFDGYGRMWGMASGSDNVLYTYTGVNLTNASRSTGGTTVFQSFIYNGPGGLLSSETTTQPGLTTTIGYGYDTLGRLQTLTYPSNRTIGYGYDALSRVNSITNNSAALVSNIKFDDWGNRWFTQFASGSQDQWDADPTGTRLKTWSIGYVSGGPESRSYIYDDATNILKTAGEWALIHDNMGRLTEADGFGIKTAHNYDAYGNATYHLATANGSAVPTTFNNFEFNPLPNNQIPGLTKTGALTGWDTNLRGEARQVGAATASSTILGLTWDGLGLLKSVGWSYGNQSFLYAPSGMRVSLTDTVTSTNNRKYAYSTGGLLLGEYLNGSGTPAWNRDVVYLGSQAVAEIDGNGVHELHSDHLGSPRMITKGSGSWGNGSIGTMDGTQAFGPYGELVSQNGYLPLTGYTGHIQTDGSNLIYMRGRYYSPAWHAFVNSDQGIDPNTWNQRAYVAGSPFLGTDPSGMIIVQIGTACATYTTSFSWSDTGEVFHTFSWTVCSPIFGSVSSQPGGNDFGGAAPKSPKPKTPADCFGAALGAGLAFQTSWEQNHVNDVFLSNNSAFSHAFVSSMKGSALEGGAGVALTQLILKVKPTPQSIGISLLAATGMAVYNGVNAFVNNNTVANASYQQSKQNAVDKFILEKYNDCLKSIRK